MTRTVSRQQFEKPATVMDLRCDYPAHFRVWQKLQETPLRKAYANWLADHFGSNAERVRGILTDLARWGFAEMVKYNGPVGYPDGTWGRQQYNHYQALKTGDK